MVKANIFKFFTLLTEILNSREAMRSILPILFMLSQLRWSRLSICDKQLFLECIDNFPDTIPTCTATISLFVLQKFEVK